MPYFGFYAQARPGAICPRTRDWKNTHRRFCRWRDRDVWGKLLDEVIEEPDFEWLMIDSSHVKVHPHAGGRGGRKSGDGAYKRGLNTKLRLAVDSHGMPVRMILTEGTTADCSQAIPLIEDIEAEHLLADKGYDSNEIVEEALSRGMNPVIPPRSNRKNPRTYDKYLYKLRHLVEKRLPLSEAVERGSDTIRLKSEAVERGSDTIR